MWKLWQDHGKTMATETLRHRGRNNNKKTEESFIYIIFFNIKVVTVTVR